MRETLMIGMNTWSVSRAALCGALLTALSAGVADAAPARVASNTNLRQGPGTSFAVITTAPAGSVVNVIRCGIEWCNVMFAGRPGYMIARNLGRGGPARAVRPAPRVVVVDPPPPAVVVPGPYYYGPRYYYGRRYYRGWRRW
jgi:uncharacterized protein YraI